MGDGIRVSRLIIAYLERAKRLYQRDGVPSPHWYRIRNATRHLFVLYGSEPAAEIGPKMLAAVRQRMLEVGCCRIDEHGNPIGDIKPNSRETANANIQLLIRMIKWGVEAELVPAETYTRAKTISPLRRGEAPDGEAVCPVSDAAVEAAMPYLSRQVRAMVRLQQLTGARPGEIAAMSIRRIERAEPSLWIYRPGQHKTAHLGRDRVIFLGPKCIEILSGFMIGRSPDAALFSPREAVQEASSGRRRKWTPRTGRKVGDSYTTGTYRQAIRRACVRAGIEPWTPHQIRHAAATRLRASEGIEAARTVLGHATLTAALVYAEADLSRAAEIARAQA